MFEDRIDAADQLARKLKERDLDNPLILAIPRGGVPMGRILARELHGELDVVLVRKLPAPGNPEFAIGAISEDGTLHAPSPYLKQISQDYVRRATDAQIDLIRRRRKQYTPARNPVDPAERNVVIVDDGSATGATRAASSVSERKSPNRSFTWYQILSG